MSKPHFRSKGISEVGTTTGSPSHFVSSGPGELCSLILVALAFVLISISLPAFLAPIYGNVAVDLYRPTLAILTIGVSLALRPASRPTHDFQLFWSPLLLAFFLRFSTVYFETDIAIIRSVLDQVNRFLAWHQKIGLVTLSLSISDRWIPVIASSVLEIWLEGSLMLTLVSMLQQRSRRTRLPSFMPIFWLILWGLICRLVMVRYAMIKASNLYWVVLLLLLLNCLSIRSVKTGLLCLLLCTLTLYLLRATETFSCGSMPHILKCRQTSGDFTILASSSSDTGQITVLQNDRYRLLKADHSLLGGEWLGHAQGQSIFTTFYMQSLAIYALPQHLAQVDVLQIGLGIGTATRAMLSSAESAHGSLPIKIDVVEIDKKVIDYARDFFAVPTPGTDARIKIYHIDASRFVSQQPNNSYNLISHDVFTGGVLSFPLFTLEFFTTLKHKLKKGGVLTVNHVYSPTIGQESFERVANTLRAVFSEVHVYLESGKLNAVNNLVFYCSDEPIVLYIPDAVQPPKSNYDMTAQGMESWRMPGFEDIIFDDTRILHDVNVDHGDSQAQIRTSDTLMALDHWKFMRQLLPTPESQIWLHC